MITFTCPQCGVGAQAPDEAAGLIGRCPACGCVAPVPIVAVLVEEQTDERTWLARQWAAWKAYRLRRKEESERQFAREQQKEEADRNEYLRRKWAHFRCPICGSTEPPEECIETSTQTRTRVNPGNIFIAAVGFWPAIFGATDTEAETKSTVFIRCSNCGMKLGER